MILKDLSEIELSHQILVVKRVDRKTEIDSYNNPIVLPGYAAVSGLQELWVFKTLEKLKIIENIEVQK